MSMQTNHDRKPEQVENSSHSKRWKRISLFLSIALYLFVGSFIYREWIVSLTPSPEQQAREAKARASSINYQYFTDAGLQYYRNQKYIEAESAFRKALEYAPDEALAYNNLGSALNGQGRWDEAIAVLEKAVSLDPGLAIAKNNLAYAKAEKAKIRTIK